ncbi:MAG TPA: ATP-binding protein, partial [Polyangiales bacterium]
ILLFLGGGLALAFAYLVGGMERAVRRASLLAATQRAEHSRRESTRDALEQTRRHEAIARFAGGLAHEFNDSLVAILALSHRIESDPDAPARVTALAGSIRLGVEVAAETASGLLALGRAHVTAPRVVALAPLLRRCESSLRRLFPAGIELVVERDTLELVFADPYRLQQALVDLALNARDAMPTSGRFELSVRTQRLEEVPAGWNAQAGTFVVITCSDTGAGMDDDTLGRVFEPFFTTKASHRSTGLGLAIVRGFIYDASGFMEVQSELGRGSIFRLFLPRPSASLLDDDRPLPALDAYSL